ncbi:Regulatory protein AsnC [Marine Group I thaumarchaeote SCGC AAA799-B03]|uniref:Regulatory protein AsnC n=4 Tax=Marine Group I TaxID=905826 RepID=A0A087S712_9ARCH|nr:Regulatory protein AsnC [Marine Group I thaumarchaeote SCGC AAA799-N04]KFM15527.1 Regulatory protein AsnC [Marine Group I thaumarchaeote SCGC AAA799-D11]KFM19254.1 Regulatory protein AsnC [Marine Group I thaumarchaeote SCGC RSA3]KFM21516.1 Regulatory protein AsnC [Marine Group I thaumarchaeote SCGC AAA799-B03]
MARAYVLIINESGKEDSVISHLRNIQSVSNAYGTFGSYDILAKLKASNEQSIQQDISNGIRKIPNIRSTLTLLVDKKPGISKTDDTEQKVLDEHMAQAYITIHCLKSEEDNIMNSLKAIAEVVEAYTLVGNYEIICKIAAPTYNEISGIISKKIRKISGIKSTITINLINNQGFKK